MAPAARAPPPAPESSRPSPPLPAGFCPEPLLAWLEQLLAGLEQLVEQTSGIHLACLHVRKSGHQSRTAQGFLHLCKCFRMLHQRLIKAI
jgi:hypothetical protein